MSHLVESAGAWLRRLSLGQKLTAMGLTVGYESQGQFAGRVRTYTAAWEKIIQGSGFKPL